MGVKIIGTGRALPAHTVTNDVLAQFVETSDEWIKERTGIRKRRIAKEETTASLAAEAALKAAEAAGIKGEEIDLIITATMSPDNFMPNTACMVQRQIKAENALCFDLNAACSGFLYGLSTACAYIEAGLCRTALVIGAETLSKLIDWTDRGTCVLFGDGAGAVIMRQDDQQKMSFVLGSDGVKGDVLLSPGISMNNILEKNAPARPYITMDGQEVFKFAVKKVPECISQLLDKTNTDIEEVGYFCLHQANERIIGSVAKRLKQPVEKFPMNLSEYGNTSAASIAILLDEFCETHSLYDNGKIVISGFGGGLTWGAALIE